MCNAFSSSVQPAAIRRLLPLMAIVQGVATLAQEWRAVVALKEVRRSRAREFRHEEVRMEAQLAALEKLLSAQVSLEEARARQFVAAMAAVSPTQDLEAVGRILDMGRDILDRPPTLPLMNARGTL